MKPRKQIKREAKHLFRLCFGNGSLDENRVRQVVQSILASKRRGSYQLAAQLERFVRLDQLRHRAEVESATPLPPDLQAGVQASLTRLYGAGLNTSFAENPSLIAGIRIKVGDDVYDGSVKAGLEALEQSF
jgi:F-type H+-transporting ATPase subunit delta